MIELCIENKMYPDILRNIKNPPKKLFLEGNIELLNTNGIAIVGARNCTKYGEKVATKFSRRIKSIWINYYKWNG